MPITIIEELLWLESKNSNKSNDIIDTYYWVKFYLSGNFVNNYRPTKHANVSTC